MKILITGAAGFIGSSLAEKLLSEGHQIVGLDNFDPFYPRYIKEFNLRNCLANPNYTFVEGDILSVEDLNGIFSKQTIDLVIHLAAKAGVRPSLDNSLAYYECNLTGTLRILETMRAHDVKKMIFASSSSVYGNNEKTPFSEFDPVDTPISPYASTKKSGELLCHVYTHLYGFDITCLRFFTVFGPRQRPDLAIHKFTRLIDLGQKIPFYGDGSTYRDYTFVSDIISGILCAAEHLGGYRIYNLGESRLVNLKTLLSTIEDTFGKKAILDMQPQQPGDVKATHADISKAQKEIGYAPNVDFAEGIGQFVTWYKENKHILYPA